MRPLTGYRRKPWGSGCMFRRVDWATSGERTPFPPARSKGARGTTPHLGTPYTIGPKVGGEPVGESSLREDRWKGCLTITRDPRGTAGARNGSKRPRSPEIDPLFPMAHGHGTDSESASDLGPREPGAEEPQPGKTAFLESGGIIVALSPAGHAEGQSLSRLLTYLRNGQ